MRFWKKQTPADTPVTAPPARPASRRHADEARRKAQRYTDLTEQPGNQHNERSTATRQREQAEREMASLRAKTVQARRLAGQIENLHQPAKVQRKGRIMSTTMSDPGQAQRMTRRTTDKPSPAGGQLNFNPLHPSMELPPEQLIRLLSLESKTKRRKKPVRPAAAAASVDEPVKLSLPTTAPASAERERDIVTAPFDDSRRSLVVPALIAGAVAGIAISAYLFRGGPEDTAPPVAQTAPAVKIKKAPRPLPAAVKPEPAAATRQGTVQRDKVIPQPKIQAEENALINEVKPDNAAVKLPAGTSGTDAGEANYSAEPSVPAIDDVTAPALMEEEPPVPAVEPVEEPTIPEQEPLGVVTTPEPVTPESPDSALPDETQVEETLLEPEPAESVPVPAETAPVTAEQTGPETVQDETPETTIDEALF